MGRSKLSGTGAHWCAAVSKWLTPWLLGPLPPAIAAFLLQRGFVHPSCRGLWRKLGALSESRFRAEIKHVGLEISEVILKWN